MNATQETTYPFKLIEVIDLILAATNAGKHSEKVTLMRVKGSALYIQRRDGGDFRIRHILRKSVFLKNLCFTPALRSVELHHVALFVFTQKLINTVFITVQCDQP